MSKIQCSDIESDLFAYLDQVLESDVVDQYDAHVRGCEACQKRVTEGQNMVANLQSVDIKQPGEAYWNGFENRVLNRINELEMDARQETKESVSAGLFGSMINSMKGLFKNKAVFATTAVVTITAVTLSFFPPANNHGYEANQYYANADISVPQVNLIVTAAADVDDLLQETATLNKPNYFRAGVSNTNARISCVLSSEQRCSASIKRYQSQVVLFSGTEELQQDVSNLAAGADSFDKLEINQSMIKMSHNMMDISESSEQDIWLYGLGDWTTAVNTASAAEYLPEEVSSGTINAYIKQARLYEVPLDVINALAKIDKAQMQLRQENISAYQKSLNFRIIQRESRVILTHLVFN